MVFSAGCRSWPPCHGSLTCAWSSESRQHFHSGSSQSVSCVSCVCTDTRDEMESCTLYLRAAEVFCSWLSLVRVTGSSLIPKHFWRNFKATLTSVMSTGTSTSGPITAANAWPELIPKTATATAIASSKLLEAAVNDRVALCE